MKRRIAITCITATAALGLAGTPVIAAPGASDTPDAAAVERATGLQVAPKGSARLTGAVRDVNPFLSLQRNESSVDYATWRAKMRVAAQKREAARQASGRVGDPVLYDEKELPGTQSNDSRAEAERIAPFGSGAGKRNAARVLGSLQAFADGGTSTLAPVAEDNGSIPLAGSTGLSGPATVTTTGAIGDGPHGSTGDATGDFDFYSIAATAGQRLVIDTSGTGLDTLVGLYDAAGTPLAADDDGGDGLASRLVVDIPATGTYYAAIVGYRSGGSFPADPMDSGSGGGVGREGAYNASFSLAKVDQDFYAVYLRPGDVLGAVARSGVADGVTIYRPDGMEMVGGVGTDASSLFPPESPLPGAGNSMVSYVAEQGGWYAVQVHGADAGDYQLDFEVYRPGGQTPGPVQRIFLDFNGQRANTGIWGGSGVRDLSPLSSFLSSWGLTKADEPALIRKITAEVTENVKADLRAKGLNPNVQVNIVNSSGSRDIFGQKRVSRVIVGGTIAESGINTLGIAQFIDPGNYNMQDQALVLLDGLSEPSGASYSLNTYMDGTSNRLEFVAQGVGNVVAHEIGHLIGSYHTDNANETANLMDAGGAGFGTLFGVGPDGIGGTADDADTDFTTDTYRPAEGFTGNENTLNVSAWAFMKR